MKRFFPTPRTSDDSRILSRLPPSTGATYESADQRDSLVMTADVYLKPYTGSRVRERIARQVAAAEVSAPAQIFTKFNEIFTEVA